MSQDYYSGALYVPSDILEDEQQQQQVVQKENINPDYQKDINNMLQTIKETKRQMDMTEQDIQFTVLQEQKNSQLDNQQFQQYQQKYPKLVKKVLKKFKMFNLTTAQINKFIKIEQKFMGLNQQDESKKEIKITENGILDQINKPEDQLGEPRKSRKNLVEVHGIIIRKKSYLLNPRFYK